MQGHLPSSSYERMLQQPQPVLTSSARRELRLQESLDTATAAVDASTRQKEASNRAEAQRVRSYVNEEMHKATAGTKGLRLHLPHDSTDATAAPLPLSRQQRAPLSQPAADSRTLSTKRSGKAPAMAATTVSTSSSSHVPSSITSSMLSARTAKTLMFSSAPARSPRGAVHVPTGAKPLITPLSFPANDSGSHGNARREHFVTGFPTPFTDSGFQSITQWARVSYEEAVVTALGPDGSAAPSHGTRDALPHRLLVSVACYLLQEVLSRDATYGPLWSLLRQPIFDAIFSPQLISAELARQAARRSRHRQKQKHQQGKALFQEDGDEEEAVAAAEDVTAAQEEDDAPRYFAPRDAAYESMADFSDFRLWYEEVDSRRGDNQALVARVEALKDVVRRSHLVLRMAQRRVERARLQSLFAAWRAHTQRTARLREAALAMVAGAARRAKEEACFLRWRRITVAGRAHRLRQTITELEQSLKAQADAHRADMQSMKAELQAEAAAHATAMLKHETLRSQMAESYHFECNVLRAALNTARRRAEQFHTHARRWERLAKTFRPQVLCPPVSAPLLQLGRQLRGWERDLAGRLVLAQRPVTGATAASPVAAQAFSPTSATGVGSSVGSPNANPATGRPRSASSVGKEAAFSSVFMRQAAVSAVLEAFLLRWVNYVMNSVTKGGGGLEAKEQLARLQRQQQQRSSSRSGVMSPRSLRLGSRSGKPSGRLGARADDANDGERVIPFSFWIPVKSLEPKKVVQLSAKKAAEDRARVLKNDGVSAKNIQAALKGEKKVAKEEAEAAAAAVAAENGPSSHLTLFALRCLVGELLRQYDTQRSLMTCADASPVMSAAGGVKQRGSAPAGDATTLASADRKGMNFLAKADSGEGGDVEWADGREVAKDRCNEGAGPASALADAVPTSLLAEGPWRAELQAAQIQKTMEAAAAHKRENRGGAPGQDETDAFAATLGNQRDALGLIPYAVHYTAGGGNDGGRRDENRGSVFASSGVGAASVAVGSDVVNVDVSANVSDYLTFLNRGGAINANQAAPLTPAIDPVFSDLSQLLIAFSAGGLYPPLLTHAKGGTGTPAPTAEQLHRFLYPSERVKQYNHNAMLWILASLFVGYARCCNGPEPFLPSTSATGPAAGKRAKGKKGRRAEKLVLLANGTTVTSEARAGNDVAPASSANPIALSYGAADVARRTSTAFSLASRAATPTCGTAADAPAQGTRIVATSTVLSRPKRSLAATDRRKSTVHERGDSSPFGGLRNTHPSGATPPRLRSAPRLASGGAAGGGTRSSLAVTFHTTDDTASDMDVYLGLRDPDVPVSDHDMADAVGDSTLDEGGMSHAERAEAELNAAVADVADAEERAMERRRRERLLKSGLLTTREVERMQSLMGSLSATAATSDGGLGGADEDGSDSNSSSSEVSKGACSEGQTNSSAPSDFAARTARSRGSRTGKTKGSFTKAGSHRTSTRSGMDTTGSIRKRPSAVGTDEAAETDANEASFWQEGPVTEGAIPAPADIGADSDVDEDFATLDSRAEEQARRRKDLAHHQRRSVAFMVGEGGHPVASTGLHPFYESDNSDESDWADDDAAEERAWRRRRILKHFPYRSTAFDSMLSAEPTAFASSSSPLSKSRPSTLTVCRVSERAERRQRTRQRRRALRNFVALTVTDRERRQQWLALARVVTALTTRLGVLDEMPKSKRRLGDPETTDADTDNSGGDGDRPLRNRRSSTRRSVGGAFASGPSSRATSGSPSRGAPQRGVGRQSATRVMHAGQGKRSKNSLTEAHASAGQQAPSHSSRPSSARQLRMESEAAASLGGATGGVGAWGGGIAAAAGEGPGPLSTDGARRPESSGSSQQGRRPRVGDALPATSRGLPTPDPNRPDPLFPSLATRGPAVPPPQPRPPSPTSFAPQGPLDPLMVRPSARYQPPPAHGGTTGLKAVFELQTKRTQ